MNGVDKRRVQREILWQTAEPLRAVGTIGPGAATPPRTGPHVSVMMMPARRRARAALTPHTKVGDLPMASSAHTSHPCGPSDVWGAPTPVVSVSAGIVLCPFLDYVFLNSTEKPSSEIGLNWHPGTDLWLLRHSENTEN